MESLLTGIHIFICVVLVLVVLVQSGRGAEISASFSSGSSQSIFGATGGANFFTRFTAVIATLFMVSSIYLTYLGGKGQDSIMSDEVQASDETSAPAAADTPTTDTNVVTPEAKQAEDNPVSE